MMDDFERKTAESHESGQEGAGLRFLAHGGYFQCFWQPPWGGWVSGFPHCFKSYFAWSLDCLSLYKPKVVS